MGALFRSGRSRSARPRVAGDTVVDREGGVSHYLTDGVNLYRFLGSIASPSGRDDFADAREPAARSASSLAFMGRARVVRLARARRSATTATHAPAPSRLRPARHPASL